MKLRNMACLNPIVLLWALEVPTDPEQAPDCSDGDSDHCWHATSEGCGYFAAFPGSLKVLATPRKTPGTPPPPRRCSCINSLIINNFIEFVHFSYSAGYVLRNEVLGV